MLLRPKTGLKDMIVEMNPGTKAAGALPEGGTIPIQNTAPDVNLDEVLSSLDSDTRSYLQILVSSGGEAFGTKGYSSDLRKTFKRFSPTNRDLAKITGLLSQRRRNLRHVVHNFSLLSQELGKRDVQLAQFVGSANANFRALASQDSNIRQSLQLLPPTLQTALTTLQKADTFARTLGPTLQALRPAARELGPALVATRPFLKTTTPIIRDQLRPFAIDAQPTTRELRIAADNLKPLTPHLINTFRVINALLNTLAFNPKGPEEGFLFWTAWANHDANTIFGTQDAHGPIRRGLVITSCDSLQLLTQVVQANPPLNTLFTLLNAPALAKVCPAQVPPTPKKGDKKTPKSAAKPSASSGTTPASPTPGKPNTGTGG
jgi:phospholipid/cholesterol/gamma-HCH transport system substrate-binding protein